MPEENSPSVPAARRPARRLPALRSRAALYILDMMILVFLAALVIHIQPRFVVLLTGAMWRALSIYWGIVALL